MNEDGKRRLDDPRDFVRIEIAFAMVRNLPIIPLLVGQASMPNGKSLPDEKSGLSFRNGMFIRLDPDCDNDLQRLFKGNHDSKKAWINIASG